MKLKFLPLILTLTLLISSCSTDSPDCDCDRVVETNYSHFYVVGVGNVYGGTFITINDCSGVQKTWSVTGNGRPRIGDCK